MDILKQELLKKRQSLAEDAGGKKFFKRSEIEQKRIQCQCEEEKREAEAKALRQKQSQHGHQKTDTGSSSSNPNSNPEISKSKPDSSSKTLVKDQITDDLNLPRQEVIRRLRFLKQSITLCGENDEAILDRLKFVLKAGLFEVDDSDMTRLKLNPEL